jgi:hypothetical protein
MMTETALTGSREAHPSPAGARLSPVQPGMASIARRLTARLGPLFLAGYRRLFQHHNYIFRYTPDGPPPARPKGLEILRFADFTAVPDSLMAQLCAFRGPRYCNCVQQELRRGAILWVGIQDNIGVASQFTRRGSQFRHWFLPLLPDDLVVFGGSTAPSARGQGIMPYMIFDHVRCELRGGSCAYADCKVWNAASIRCIEKAGFRRIATMKPLSRRESAGRIA